jgi:hypothetical protein
MSKIHDNLNEQLIEISEEINYFLFNGYSFTQKENYVFIKTYLYNGDLKFITIKNNNIYPLLNITIKYLSLNSKFKFLCKANEYCIIIQEDNNILYLYDLNGKEIFNYPITNKIISIEDKYDFTNYQNLVFLKDSLQSIQFTLTLDYASNLISIKDNYLSNIYINFTPNFAIELHPLPKSVFNDLTISPFYNNIKIIYSESFFIDIINFNYNLFINNITINKNNQLSYNLKVDDVILFNFNKLLSNDELGIIYSTKLYLFGYILYNKINKTSTIFNFRNKIIKDNLQDRIFSYIVDFSLNSIFFYSDSISSFNTYQFKSSLELFNIKNEIV